MANIKETFFLKFTNTKYLASKFKKLSVKFQKSQPMILIHFRKSQARHHFQELAFCLQILFLKCTIFVMYSLALPMFDLLQYLNVVMWRVVLRREEKFYFAEFPVSFAV